MNTWKELENATKEQFLGWAESQPWCVPMQSCEQEPVWHAEGDVWTHTKMVLDEVFKLDSFKLFERHEQLALIFTAIFHDSGKPATTKLDEESGRIRSMKHAQVGSRIARRALMELNCEFRLRELICHLVLFHGRPPYLGSRRSAEHDVIQVSSYLSNKLLYLFALADTRGRVCEVKSERHPEELLELWKAQSEELGCFDGPFPFKNHHARLLFYRNQLDNLHYRPFEKFNCTMTIMSGLPGAGKDTWLAKHRPALPVISLDEIRRQLKVEPTGNQGVVIQKAKEECRQHLRDGNDFCVNATQITRQIRKLWIDIGVDYNAKIEIIYIEPDLKTVLSQNSSRTNKAQVPSGVIQKLFDKLEPPTIAECHEIVFVT